MHPPAPTGGGKGSIFLSRLAQFPFPPLDSGTCCPYPSLLLRCCPRLCVCCMLPCGPSPPVLAAPSILAGPGVTGDLSVVLVCDPHAQLLLLAGTSCSAPEGKDSGYLLPPYPARCLAHSRWWVGFYAGLWLGILGTGEGRGVALPPSHCVSWSWPSGGQASCGP